MYANKSQNACHVIVQESYFSFLLNSASHCIWLKTATMMQRDENHLWISHASYKLLAFPNTVNYIDTKYSYEPTSGPPDARFAFLN